MEQPTGHNLTQQSGKPQSVSLREQSVSTIQAAIHSQRDDGAVLERTNAILSLYYDPDLTPETRAAVREEFVRALGIFPLWAVHKAFDQWARTGTRRPSPAEIAILAEREIKPYIDELAIRRRAQQAIAEHREPPSPDDLERRRSFAQGILARFGFARHEKQKGPVRVTVTDDDRAEMRAMLDARFPK
jgi:hypothetical protein